MTRSQTSQSSPTKNRPCCPVKKLSYSCKVWCMILVCLLLVAAAVSLMYLLLTKKRSGTLAEDIRLTPLPKKTDDWTAQCPAKLLLPEERFDCYPEDGRVDKSSCETRGCCYLGGSLRYGGANGSESMPSCVYPNNYGYVSVGKTAPVFNGFVLPLRRLPAPSRYGDDIQVVHMKVEMQTKYRLRIKFYDPENYRFEVPVPKVPTHSSAQSPEQSAREVFLYSITYDIHNEPFAIKVRRSNTDAVIFDTSAGALALSNQFLELTTKLPSFKIFGLGQNARKQQQHEFNWNTFSMFSSKAKAGVSSGVQPMYLCLEDDGNAHGVLLLNSNAMEMQLHPLPAVTFRAIGGVLDFYLFLGPSPEDVIQQYTEAVGRPSIPPYWALGLHVGHPTYQSTEEIEKFIEGFKAKHIPVESLILYQDIAMKVVSKSYNFNGFSNFTSKLKSRNQKIIIQLEASIPKDSVLNRNALFSGSLQKDIFITDKWGWTPIEGKYHSNAAVYPDFGSSETLPWWSKVIKKIPFEFEGVWLINNEPTSNVDGSSNGCLSDNLNSPPYVPKSLSNSLYEKTLCMDALLHWRLDVVTHYDFHNLYGHSMAMATEQALNINFPSKRKLLLSDSTFVGTGQFAGHYIKGIENNWDGLRSSISAVMELSLYGVALAGVSVCDAGDIGNDDNSTELCLRWLQCSIFYPFLQLHYGGAEYFYKAGLANKEIFHAVRNALSRRYELLPQLYTLFYLAHTKGSTVVRPIFHNFPTDNETYSISSQFMWGSSILISPILEQGAKELTFYIPKGLWYDYYQGGPLFSAGEWFTETQGLFEDTKQPAVLHIRGGHIITLQKPAETTTISRQNSMSILVALNASYEASGLLYWDDGETKNSHLLGEYLLVEYFATGNSLTVTGHFGKKVLKSSFYKAAIEQVRIMGLSKPPKRIYIDSDYILSNKQYHWNYDTSVLDLKLILIPLGRKTEIKWYF